AAFDKPVWRALDALARPRGMVLASAQEMPGGVEVRGVAGRAYFRDSAAFLKEAKSLQSRSVSLLESPQSESDDESVDEVAYQTHQDVIETNLNLTAEFPDESGKIACRHLTADWILRRQAHLAAPSYPKPSEKPAAVDEESPARFSFAPVASSGLIAENLSKSAYEAFEDRIMSPHCRRSIVHLSRLSDFVKDQFATLESGQNRHFLCATLNHAMGIELRCKPAQGGGPRYVLNFYDPNRTVTSRRIGLDSLDEIALDVRDLLSQAYLQTYFGESPADWAALLFEVAPAVPGESKARAESTAQSAHYTTQAAGQGCAPVEMFYRALWGEERDLEAFLHARVLLAASDSASNLRRLQGSPGGAVPSALQAALQSGHHGVAKAMTSAAAAAVSDGRLTAEDFQVFVQSGQAVQPAE
ncbi:MAG: ShET2/EspL2 family type III secretion system effector toxin, partial [Rubrivivax sp.]